MAETKRLYPTFEERMRALEELRTELEELRAELEDLRAENARLREENARLRGASDVEEAPGKEAPEKERSMITATFVRYLDDLAYRALWRISQAFTPERSYASYSYVVTDFDEYVSLTYAFPSREDGTAMCSPLSESAQGKDHDKAISSFLEWLNAFYEPPKAEG